MANKDPNFVQTLLGELDSLSTITETFTLPTKGLLDGIPSEVVMRMMTTHEEKIRTGSKSTFWKTIAGIIDKCVVEPKINSYNLTVVDFIFLMYKLRILSYGKEYKVNLSTCPICKKHISDPVIDLDKLEIRRIGDEDIGDFKEPFQITLPRTKWTIECRLLRMKEYDELAEEAKRKLEEFPNYEGDPIVPLRLMRQIVSIKGQRLERANLEAIVNRLPAEDENAITQYYDSLNFGLNTVAKYQCPKCKDTIHIPLSYSEEFFRPTPEQKR